jgi:hypothetical protein
MQMPPEWHHDDGMVVTWEMQGGNYVVNHNIGVVTNDWQIRGTGSSTWSEFAAGRHIRI